jgi:hypothetical protein
MWSPMGVGPTPNTHRAAAQLFFFDTNLLSKLMKSGGKKRDLRDGWGWKIRTTTKY